MYVFLFAVGFYHITRAMLLLLKLLEKVNMLKRLPLWRPVLGYIVITTAVIIAILQVMALPLWPMSKSFYRRVASCLSHPMMLRELLITL